MSRIRPPLANFLHFLGVMVTRGVADLFLPVQKVTAEPIVIKHDELRLWMIGHSTVLINLYGTTILTDPVLVNWLPFPRRVQAAAYTAAVLPPMDVIVVSHAHMDHLNRATLASLSQKTKTLIIPAGCEDLVADLGFPHVIPLDWNESCTAASLEVTAVRPQHWGERYPWQHRGRRYHSYVLTKNGVTVFFAGDTAYGSYFKDVGSQHDVSVAILPIGAYHPEKYYNVEHMNPEQALQAFLDLKARFLIPMHWGSFRFTREPADEPPRRLLEAAITHGVTEQVYILRNGQSMTIPPP